MIISGSKKFVLFHLPKNGGSSVQNALCGLVESNDQDVVIRPRHRLVKEVSGEVVLKPRAMKYFAGRNAKANRVRRILNWPENVVQAHPIEEGGIFLDKHATATQLKGFLSPEFYAKLKQVIIVRNPYARAFSSYNYYLKRGLVNEHDHQRFYGGQQTPPSFEEFLDNPECRKMLATLPQAHWLASGRKPDFILHTETLAEDMQKTLPQLGFDLPITEYVHTILAGERKNASTRPGEWRQMTARARDLILRNYEEDFDLLEYPRDIQASN